MKKKIKIAVIGAKGFPARGGAARSNEEIYRRLVDRCDVTVYAMSTHANQKDYHGIKQMIIKVPKHHWGYVVWYLFASAVHALLFEKYDVVHVNHLSSGFILPILRIKYRVLLNAHGLSFTNDEKWSSFQLKVNEWLERLGLLCADSVVSVSKSGDRELTRLGANAKYIPNGADLNLGNNLSFVNNRLEGAEIVFAAARIIPLKGLHDFLRALQLIDYRGKIGIIGDLDQIQTYKDLIMGLIGNIDCVFTGLISSNSELFSSIKSANLFVFPSHSEGMSNMLLEVAMIEVPIIASNIAQNRDVFADDEVLFFECGDPQDLAEKISWALQNSNEMASMAKKALKRVRSDYDWDSIASSYYKELSRLATMRS